MESLDTRERRALDLIFAGHPNKAIERKLKLSRRTVERVRSSILAKTNFLSFVELSAAYGETRAAEGEASLKTATNAARHSQLVPVSTTTAERPQDSGGGNEGNWRWLCCDLHDGAAQYVSAALLRRQAIESQHKIPAEAIPHLRMAGALLDVALRDIRDIIAGRSPACSMQLGIIPSVKRLVHDLAGTSGIEIDFVEASAMSKLSTQLETAVYRILQECLNNAIRHSGSDRVRVEMVETPGRCGWRCAIGGVALIPTRSPTGVEVYEASVSVAELLGGRASIETEPGWGTLVAVELPLKTS